jgi:hypothetical protein
MAQLDLIERADAGRLQRADILPFLLAGNAVFTLENTRNGARFTYKVQQCVEEDSATGQRVAKPLHVVKVLTGPDHTNDYQYFGHIKDGHEYTYGRKARMSAEAPSVKAFAWLWDWLQASQPLPEQVLVSHEGRCGRCGRVLTTPESIRRSYGPDCWTLLHPTA